jgi:CRP-like cAMP-binding protein
MFGVDTHKASHSGVPTERLALLRRLPMFAHYSDEDLTRVDALVYETTLPAGARLAVEGQVRRQAFILLSGQAVVSADDSVIARLGFGDLVGEMSLIANCRQSATVTAATPVRVLVMDPREFGTLMSDPRAARWLAGDLTERLREAQQRATSSRSRRHTTPPLTAMHVPA